MCPPTLFSDHRISASRKICSTPQKDFFDSIGHQRRFDVGGMSAIAPTATKMLRRDERRRSQVQKSRATISRAACPWNCPPTARTQGGTGQSSIQSRSEHRNQYHGAWHGASAHWARSALGRSCRCWTEARQQSSLQSPMMSVQQPIYEQSATELYVNSRKSDRAAGRANH